MHRDLKPSNIMLTSDGHVKLMDFGLAKRASGAQEDTQQVDVTKLTREGATLGTVPYMSPEQLKGEVVDTRSDIFSFGIILYEMLAGVHPFIKPDAMATASSILQEEPAPVGLHRAGISPVIQYVVRKMLAKELKSRYQLVHDIHTDLVALQQDPGPAAVLTGQIRRTASQSKLPWVATFLLGVILATGASFWLRVQPVPSQPLRRFPLTLPATQALPTFSGNLLAISPNGQTAIYRGFEDGETRLYRRNLDQLDAMPIPGTEGALPQPIFSHDGKRLAFSRVGDNSIMRVELTGGRPVRIGQLPVNISGASWTL